MTISLTLGNTGFPFRDGFVADAQGVRQLPLGEPALFPHFCDEPSGFDYIHPIPPFLP